MRASLEYIGAEISSGTPKELTVDRWMSEQVLWLQRGIDLADRKDGATDCEIAV
jgi:hypothetical protein